MHEIQHYKDKLRAQQRANRGNTGDQFWPPTNWFED
jgi:hypothetical protein